MKVLFLDIDSVLNTSKTPTRQDAAGHLLAMDPYKVFMVNNAVDKYGWQVVLSSDWRHMPDWEETMKANGLVFKFLGRTPNYGSLGLSEEEDAKANVGRLCRGYEIKVWMDAHPEVEKYAILDDTDEFLTEQRGSFFQTDYKVGLTEELMERVVKHLEG